MARIVAITGCPTGVAHTYMAAEALKKTAAILGHELKVETQGAEGVKSPLSPADIEAADVVIVASDVHVDMARFAGKPMVAVPVADAIRKTRVVIENALAEWKEEHETPTLELQPVSATAPAAGPAKRLVAVTACPTGIAPPEASSLNAVVQDWLNEFERVQWILRLSPRLRRLRGD